MRLRVTALRYLLIIAVLSVHIFCGPRPATASIYGPAPYTDNLLQNPNGDSGDLSGWTITRNGGNGWTVDLGRYQHHMEDNGFLTSYFWAEREQTVDLLAQGFTPDFLDSQPIIMVSEMFEKVFCPDYFFLQIEVLDVNHNVIFSWSSGQLQHKKTSCDYSGYKEQVKTELAHYGSGMRYIRWRDGGKDSEFWWGHFGPKLQNAYLSLASANLLREPDELSSWTVLSDDPEGSGSFEVTGPPGKRKFMTSYRWGRRQQIVDLLAMGFSAAELDLGKLPILARGTYGEVACPDNYYLKVELLDQNYTVLSTRDSGIRTHGGECDWTYSGYSESVHHRFDNYPPGVRYIRWEDGGVDTEGWAGNYGATLEAPYLTIVDYDGVLSSTDGRVLAPWHYVQAAAYSAFFWAGAAAACIGTFGIGCAPAVGVAAGVTVTTFGATALIVPAPVSPEPTDPQVTPECDAGCKFGKISQGIEHLTNPKLWSLDRSNALQVLSSPKDGAVRLQAPTEELLQVIEQTVGTGNQLIDITTLMQFESPWADRLAEALKVVEARATSNSTSPVVRIYLGIPGLFLYSSYQGKSPLDWNTHLRSELAKLTSKLSGSGNMTIYIAGGRKGDAPIVTTNWNHSKVIAVDGRESIVGGHNLWHPYFDQQPVFDVSVKVSGDPARSAHRFVDQLWIDHKAKFPASNGDTYALKWHKGSTTAYIHEDYISSDRLGDFSVSPAGNIRVLSLGQLGWGWGISPVKEAVIKMVNAATQSIYISQQALVHPNFSLVDAGLAAELVKKAVAGVSVEIVLSNPNAPHGTKSHVHNNETLKRIWDAAVDSRAVDNTLANREAFCQNLSVASLRIDEHSETYPNTGSSFANHAKTIMVDKQVFLIGSHNLYDQSPMQLSEFAYLIAEPENAQHYFDTYWEPLLRYSRRTQNPHMICIGVIARPDDFNRDL